MRRCVQLFNAPVLLCCHAAGRAYSARRIEQAVPRIAQADHDVHLREFAVCKLGDLGAVEVKDKLRELAETLSWSDLTRTLKWRALDNYWRLVVFEATSQEKQVALLKQALHVRLNGIIASSTQRWAADELANRGVRDALPEITKSIRLRNPTKAGEEPGQSHVRSLS
jgi:hypothetical protein